MHYFSLPSIAAKYLTRVGIDVGDADDDDGDDMILPFLTVLPMGWSWSLFFVRVFWSMLFLAVFLISPLSRTSPSPLASKPSSKSTMIQLVLGVSTSLSYVKRPRSCKVAARVFSGMVTDTTGILQLRLLLPPIWIILGCRGVVKIR